MRRLVAFLFALAFVSPAYAQQSGGPGGGGSSITTPVSPANGGSGVANSANLTWNNAFTLTGTSAQTYTFPTTTATIARTDAAQSFTGLQTFSSGTASAGGYQISANGHLDMGAVQIMANKTVTCSPTCTVSAQAGSAAFKLTLSGANSTTTITPGFTATNGFVCTLYDMTTTTERSKMTATTTTTATMTWYNDAGTATSTGASDVLWGSCIAL